MSSSKRPFFLKKKKSSITKFHARLNKEVELQHLPLTHFVSSTEYSVILKNT